MGKIDKLENREEEFMTLCSRRKRHYSEERNSREIIEKRQVAREVVVMCRGKRWGGESFDEVGGEEMAWEVVGRWQEKWQGKWWVAGGGYDGEAVVKVVVSWHGKWW